MSNKIIIYIGDHPKINTGMGFISRSLIDELAKRYPDDKIFVLARYEGNVLYDIPKNVFIIDIPAKFSIGEAAPMILNFIQQIDVNDLRFILVQGDIFYFDFFHILRRKRWQGKIFGYLNLDAEDIPVKNLETLFCFDGLIFPSKFNIDEIKKHSKYIPEINKLNCIIVPHGLDKNWPVQVSEERYTDLTFITVANNIARKNYHTIIKALSKLKSSGSDKFKWICVSKLQGDTDISKLTVYYGILQNTLFMQDVSTEQLRELYAKSHYLLLASFGEGFCLPIIEAISQGTPSIVPNNSVFMDVAKETAIYVNSPGIIQTMHQYSFSVPSFKSLCEKLDDVYSDFYFNNKKLWRKLVKKCQEYQHTHLISNVKMAEDILNFIDKSLQDDTQYILNTSERLLYEENLSMRQLEKQNTYVVDMTRIQSNIHFIYQILVILNTIKEKYPDIRFVGLNINPQLSSYYIKQIFTSFMNLQQDLIVNILSEPNYLDENNILQKFNFINKDTIKYLKRPEILPEMKLDNLSSKVLGVIYDNILLQEFDLYNIQNTLKDYEIIIVPFDKSVQISDNVFKNFKVLMLDPIIFTGQDNIIKLIPYTQNPLFYYEDIPNAYYLLPYRNIIPDLFIRDDVVVFKSEDWLNKLSLKLK